MADHENHDGRDLNIVDGDDVLDRFEEDQMISPEIRRRRRCTEERVVCEMLLLQWQRKHGMNSMYEVVDNDSGAALLDPEELAERRRTVMCLAAALEELGRRQDAIDSLRLCLGVGQEYDYDSHIEKDHEVSVDLDVVLALALAKLYFKGGYKENAIIWCDAILEKLRNSMVGCSVEDCSDAYHLAGWVKIHADDHTGAYQLWMEGHLAVPECELLARQYRKRVCWDNHNPAEVCDPILLGSENPSLYNDLEAFRVPEENIKQTHALALFEPTVQKNALVFRSRQPVLTEEECKEVLGCVEAFHQDFRGGQWGTVRHSSVKTTDVAVEDIPALRPWLRDLLRTRLYPLLAVAYPRLADGSTPGELGNRMRVHDAFIVRYDAECDGSISLPEHSDTSAMSFTVALNSRATCCETGGDAAFEGGGTWFEALGDANKSGKVVDAEVGHAVAFAGPLRHAGYPVVKGCRVILVLFLYVDGFPYGHFLNDYMEQHNMCDTNACEVVDDEKKEDAKSESSHLQVRPSGDMPGGFVVYNQTVELVSMLNRKIDSVLD